VVELSDPWSLGDAIPKNDTPWCGLRGAAEEGDVVTLGMEVPGEEVAYLSGAAGDDDLHDVVCFS
jgi:hypothetical protein